MDWEYIQERLIRLLRLRTTPVGVKLLKKREDIPAEVERPKIHLTGSEARKHQLFRVVMNCARFIYSVVELR